ncbi:MAG: hypothetical protein ACXAD7_07050 [Candidatus Kariarchaeaceae archaeon]|jgi:hypothetical protein
MKVENIVLFLYAGFESLFIGGILGVFLGAYIGYITETVILLIIISWFGLYKILKREAIKKRMEKKQN